MLRPRRRKKPGLKPMIRWLISRYPFPARSSMGQLPQAAYDADNDISFYEGLATNYFDVKVGQFTIYFPSDGHAPAITPVTTRKAIFKVKA